MKRIAMTLFGLTYLVSCSTAQKPNAQALAEQDPVYQEMLKAANEDAARRSDTLGSVIQTIDFKQKATGEDLETFKSGYIPWISIDKPQQYLNKLIDADKIVITSSKAKIIIDYPLAYPVTFEINTTSKGFTRKDLILKISEQYHKIYQQEEQSAKTKTVPLDKREGLINRNQTDGQYGIWGHDISDLDLSNIEVYQTVNGEIVLALIVES